MRVLYTKETKTTKKKTKNFVMLPTGGGRPVKAETLLLF
jgi:hypothetical protein